MMKLGSKDDELSHKGVHSATALKTSSVKPQELQIQPQVNVDPCSHSFKYLTSTACLVYLRVATAVQFPTGLCSELCVSICVLTA